MKRLPKSQQARDLKGAEPSLTPTEIGHRLDMKRQAVERALQFASSQPGRKRRQTCQHCHGSGVEPQPEAWDVSTLSSRAQRLLGQLHVAEPAALYRVGREGMRAVPGAGAATVDEIEAHAKACGYGPLPD
jgi:cytochrome c5